MEQLKQHVWETDRDELQKLIDTGYQVVYQDVSLSVIYDELTIAFTDAQINEQFGYYGLSGLLLVDGMFYWIMQV